MLSKAMTWVPRALLQNLTRRSWVNRILFSKSGGGGVRGAGGEGGGAGRGDIWMDAGEDGTPDFLVT